MEEDELEQPVTEEIELAETDGQQQDECPIKCGAIGVDCEVTIPVPPRKARSLILSAAVLVLSIVMTVTTFYTQNPFFFLIALPIAGCILLNGKELKGNRTEVLEAAVVAEPEQLTIWIPGSDINGGAPADKLYLTQHRDVLGYMIDPEKNSFTVRSRMFLEQLWQDNQLIRGQWMEKTQMRLTVVDPESLEHLTDFMNGCQYRRIWD